jgi:hypothetical protein
MTLRLLLGSAVLTAAAALAACGGNNNGFSYPTPGPTCNPGTVGVTAYQLVYPAPGATNVPVSTQEMVVALNTPLPNYTWNLGLAAAGNNYLTGNTLAPITASQLPPGSATTTIPNPAYEAVQLISQLPASSVITVSLNNTSTTCSPVSIPDGSFTTEQ